MKLHENEQLFRDLIAETAEHIELPEVYIEKDYWVTKALKNLSQSEHLDNVVFKGGTSLSKAYRLIDRFSEDIDLAIIDEGLSDSARKKKLKNVERFVSTGLREKADDPRVSKGSKFRRTVYEYPKMLGDDDSRSASPELLLEINSFTIPEPNQSCSLSSLVAQALINIDRIDIVNEYDLASFSINVLSVKRTLTEKIIRCVKDSYAEDPISAMSKGIRHLYDICKILKKDEYAQFISTNDFLNLCDVCVANEKDIGLDGAENLDKPLCEAPLFVKFDDISRQLEGYYHSTFSDFVYDALPDMAEIVDALESIRHRLNK